MINFLEENGLWTGSSMCRKWLVSGYFLLCHTIIKIEITPLVNSHPTGFDCIILPNYLTFI